MCIRDRPFITPLDTLKELPYKAMVNVSCDACNKKFQKTKFRCQPSLGYENRKIFCNLACRNKGQEKPKHEIICLQCNKQFTSSCNYDSYRKFCSNSCSATYRNTHKKHGTRRSKLEIWLEQSLTSIYPNLEVHFNRKDAINSELDIYIPPLKLAFELNGIYHYEPIHGDKNLDRIKNNDNRKFQACLENNIELCIIDTSHQLYFKEQTSKIFLNIIRDIIEKKMVESSGIEPPTTKLKASCSAN
jgi:hypothetical protein